MTLGGGGGSAKVTFSDIRGGVGGQKCVFGGDVICESSLISNGAYHNLDDLLLNKLVRRWGTFVFR